ncbi:hypothetical protein [Thiothrix lacustris]|uniref:hypothetical protein n=1 Tax=Thiothrix lacustris TaxID=525917 RepID=UPI0027E4F868|nr:hypothetical protein [Thiothrix lacustris]WMP15844.1 hypothetical protein RCS87_10595 [Thiothrix lacustris]
MDRHFHISDGIFITAKHVIENNKIIEVATTKRIELIQENLETKEQGLYGFHQTYDVLGSMTLVLTPMPEDEKI